MKKLFPRMVPGLLAAALLLNPASGHAAAKKPAKPAAKAEAAPSVDPGYEQWLKKYGAYDRISQPANGADAADALDDPGASSLKRAQGNMLQGAPHQALEIIKNQKPYEDQALETQRLWLGGQAYRALGDPFQAVLWYSQAAKLMDEKQLKARLTGEAGLDALWIDVWRRQFWSFVGNPSASREALAETLRTLQAQADMAWGQENFWQKSRQAMAQATGEEPEAAAEAAPAKSEKAAKPEKAEKPGKDATLAVSEAERLRIAQAVAAAGMEDYERAKGQVSELGDAALKEFWTGLVTFLEKGKAPGTKALTAAGYAKASGFWNANLLAPYADSREEWLLGGASPAWARFKTRLAKLSRAEAQETVDKELGSLLLSEEMSRLLRAFKFALTLQEGEVDAARELWAGLEKRRLPIALRLAGGLAFQDDVKTLLPQEIGAAAKLSPAMGALLAAGGIAQPLAGEAPFWTRQEIGKNSAVNKNWPLDRLLVLADWQARWAAAPGQEIARRSAFLFPDTAYGYDCLLYLARQAVENKSNQLAETYLNRLGQLSADKSRQANRLGLKARMLRDSGRDEEALAAYKELLALGMEADARSRLDMATFLQLKNDFETARGLLLGLWAERDKMPKSTQAEILFWLGEGEHSLRNYDAALDYYLRLAYQYPQEPMWPTAAMYRSAMIYEIMGKYEPARKLLNSVIGSADTKEAKEAARNRLNALETKAGKPSAKENGEPVYPF